MNNVFFSSNKDNWTTPLDLFNKLNALYGFEIDACADNNNHLCPIYFTKENSVLNNVFYNRVIFINPPYGRNMGVFIKWCYEQAKNNCKIVLLVPSRTDTNWFHNYIYNKKNVRIEFLKGRLHFGNSKNVAPFPSMLVYFNL